MYLLQFKIDSSLALSMSAVIKHLIEVLNQYIRSKKKKERMNSDM